MASVFLRHLDVSDLDKTFAWHNSRGLYVTLGSPFRYVSRTSEDEWLRKRALFSSDEVNLAICLTETGEHVGNVYLREIDWTARTGEVHIFLGDPDYRGKGYGTQALRDVARHAFSDLGLQRLYLSVLAENAGAIRAYEKCGFVTEGTLRRHAFKRGRYVDVLLMGLCIEDWTDNGTA